MRATPGRPDERDRLRRAIAEHEGVEDVLELLGMYSGPHSTLVAARIDLRDELSGEPIEQLSDDIDARLREELPDAPEVLVDATPRHGTRVRKTARVE